MRCALPLLVLPGCGDGHVPSPPPPPRSLQVELPGLQDGVLPDAHRCGGTSPALHWSGAPAQTQSFALIIVAPDELRVHWTAWDLPPTTQTLPAGVSPTDHPPTQGAGSDGIIGYRPPCPEEDTELVVRLYALRTPLVLPPTASMARLQAAVSTTTLAWGERSFTVRGGKP